MAKLKTLHKRVFTLTVEFTDDDRQRCFDKMGWRPGDGYISDAIVSEVTTTLAELKLHATVVRN